MTVEEPHDPSTNTITIKIDVDASRFEELVEKARRANQELGRYSEAVRTFEQQMKILNEFLASSPGAVEELKQWAKHKGMLTDD